jgi:hypothetical protein
MAEVPDPAFRLSSQVRDNRNDVTENAIFKEMQATQTAPDPMEKKRGLQTVADPTLTKLNTRAVAPRLDDTDAEYMAMVGTQLAAFGPEERKTIDRFSLARENQAALAVVFKDDLAIADEEGEHPNHSLKNGETRIIERVDISGRPMYEFYNKDGCGFWLNQFKGDTVRTVSGGLHGFANEDKPRGSWYRFDKVNTNPELRAIVAEAARQDSPEFRIRRAYVDANLPPPSDVEIARMLRK